MPKPDIQPDVLADWDYELNGDMQPELADPALVAWWRCSNCRSVWQAAITTRSEGEGCPRCARLGRGRHGTLAAECPDLLADWCRERNMPLAPGAVTAGSGRRVWWRCRACGHEWQTKIVSRARRAQGCPSCARERRRRRGTLLEEMPELARSWDWERNDPRLGPDAVTCGSARKVWWRCPFGHSWEAVVAERARGIGCPTCAGHYEAPLAQTDPALASEWDLERNAVGPDGVTAGSTMAAWWRCGLGHSWSAVVGDRTKGHGCPTCAGRFDGPLIRTHPWLIDEWVEATNGPVPESLTAGSGYRAMWCCNAGHNWVSEVKARAAGHGCPSCARVRVAQALSQSRQGEAGPTAVLTGGEVAVIRKDERTNAELARLYGVSATTVYAVRARRTWRHVP